ncbi:Os04g0457100 [Oryza sativa Japonica Group]|uniref:Os04g0457100 protein n=2 Tax=Oryza sativa subsp. japonica TaxID=39947 RepID=Q0JCQ3_ORYSJ|nr:hypothetical protein EE612_023708 [Oryza sativa]BAF14884.1 Os04g0457100 [Oryza sativa Japonica Group]BAS89511.1 Os04g0457100 [Oryza sativa Japonica Group]|eukprot:NP_001052970.1 Os04g0457100 [Oryza sativa Japonica Group]
MSSSCVPRREPKEKGAMASGCAPASNHGTPLHACPTKIPSTAAIAHRPWISSASLYHLRNAGSLPSPSGSKPKSPGSLPVPYTRRARVVSQPNTMRRREEEEEEEEEKREEELTSHRATAG